MHETYLKGLRKTSKVEDIEEMTGCKKNCQYREYTIIETVGHPDRVENHSWFRISLASSSITVKNQTLIMSARSLVAEIGGTLGLFLGFSFIMIWDQIERMILFVKNVYS